MINLECVVLKLVHRLAISFSRNHWVLLVVFVKMMMVFAVALLLDCL